LALGGVGFPGKEPWIGEMLIPLNNCKKGENCMIAQANEDLLREIDKLELSDRIRRWQKAMKACPNQIYVDRQKLALESWKETEGEDIEMRRAKLLKKIVENIPIKIHDFDVLAHQINYGIHNVVVGWVDANGNEVSNELSYLILHVIGLLKMSSPTVSLRWKHNTPRWLLDKGLETNSKTRGGIPLFQNEEHVIASFVRDGIPPKAKATADIADCTYEASEPCFQVLS
jgi:pyruvate-formate lyase